MLTTQYLRLFAIYTLEMFVILLHLAGGLTLFCFGIALIHMDGLLFGFTFMAAGTAFICAIGFNDTFELEKYRTQTAIHRIKRWRSRAR